MAAHSKPSKENEEESATLAALDGGGRLCFLTCAWSGTPMVVARYCKTNEVLSVLFDGGPKRLSHKRPLPV